MGGNLTFNDNDDVQLKGATDLTLIGNVGDSLKTNVTASALPTGAATSANQTTANTSLSSIDTKTLTAGQKIMANSSPVVLSSDQSGINTFLDKNATGSLTALNQTVVVATGGMSSAIAQITGTFSAIVSFEASVDGGVTYPIATAGIYLNTNLIPILNLNSTGEVGFYVGAYTHFRVRVSAYTSGTVAVVINTGTGSLSNIATQIVRLSDSTGQYLTSSTINSKQRLDTNSPSEGAAGSAVPFDTVQVGGTDGTNLRALNTDTSGRLRLAPSSFFHPVYTTRVQSVTTATTVASGSSVTATIAATKAGNTIIVSAACNAGTLTISDSAAQSYSTATTLAGQGTQTSKIFYFTNTAAGVTTVTISSTSNTDLNLVVTEYSGLLTASVLDQTSTHGQTATTSWTSNATATTAQATELLIGMCMGTLHINTTFTPATIWSSVATINNTRGGSNLEVFMAEQSVISTGTYAFTGTSSQNENLYASIAAFKYVTPNTITPINTAVTVKSGAGVLRRVVLNTAGTGSASVVMYDSTTATGTIVATLSLLGAVSSLDYGIAFSTGLTIFVNSNTPDFTVIYE